MSQYATFAEFYPFYLSQHDNAVCRRLHVVGSWVVLGIVAAVVSQWLAPVWLWSLPLVGYGFAWVGHFFYEHNRPATFQHPVYSLMGDWVMFWQVMTRQIAW